MTITADIELEEQVLSAIEQLATTGLSDSLAPGAQRQAAIVALGMRTAETSDIRAAIRDAAALAAECLDADFCGVAENRGNHKQPAFWLCPTVDAGEGPSWETDEPAGPRADADAESMASYAIAKGRPVVSTNAAGDDRFDDPVLQDRDIKSAIVVPLICENQSFGAIGAFSTQTKSFSQEDVLFVGSIANLLITTMVRQAAEQALKDTIRQQEKLLATLDALVLELTPDGRICAMNPACQEVIGFTEDEVKGRPIWSAFLIPEEVGVIQSMFDRLHDGDASVDFQSYVLTKQGERRRLRWSFSAMYDGEQEISQLIGTGIDISEQCAAEEELERVRELAEQTQKSMEELKARGELGDGQRPFQQLPENLFTDRRDRPRRAYPYLQSLAPIVHGVLPSPQEFEEVRCRDISAGGFSFLSRVEPLHDEYVVAFGAAPALTYLVAQAVHSTPIDVNGETLYVVGCRYTRRVKYTT